MTLQEINAELKVLAAKIEAINCNEYGVPCDQEYTEKLLNREEELFTLLGLKGATLMIVN